MVGNKIEESKNNQQGFTVLQLVIVVAIIAITSTIAILGITSSRRDLSISASARQLAAHLEKVRLDAIRRHATASVHILDSSRYSILMDLDGSGVAATQIFHSITGSRLQVIL